VDMKGRSIELFNDRARAAGLTNVKCVSGFQLVLWVVFASPHIVHSPLRCICLSTDLSIYPPINLFPPLVVQRLDLLLSLTPGFTFPQGGCWHD